MVLMTDGQRVACKGFTACFAQSTIHIKIVQILRINCRNYRLHELHQTHDLSTKRWWFYTFHHMQSRLFAMFEIIQDDIVVLIRVRRGPSSCMHAHGLHPPCRATLRLRVQEHDIPFQQVLRGIHHRLQRK